MNLMKLFNLKYFLQNVKKSKALIILLTIVVPMFTSIMLLSIDTNYAIPFWELSIINIIGMYIIPIALSMTLFSYVYKKNSVDFMGSMPLSRSTIFLTNTIGGIAIIIIMQLITLISTLFLSKILSGLIIFGSMLWDIFVFYTVAYIFVFTVSNLAMSFSGNKFSQLVSICLILFLIPFIIMSCDAFGDDYSYINIEEKIAYSSGEMTPRITIDNPEYFTAPNYIFGMITGAEYKYTNESVVKMLVLTIIYTIIGLFIFKRKRLEMAGESYEKEIIHLVVKMLTFIPFMFIYCSLSNSDKSSVFLFFVAIMAVYYFLFDLITNKKIKMKISIPAFIISWVLVFAVYEGIIPKFGRNNIDIIKINEVQSVCIESINYTSYSSRCSFGLLIEDEELIKLILTEAGRSYPESSSYIRTPAAELETVVYDNPIEEEKYVYRGFNTNLIIKLENGKTFEYSIYIDSGVYKEILENLGEAKVTKNFEGFVPLCSGIYFSRQDEKEIIESINSAFNDLTYNELYDIYTNTFAEYNLNLCTYENHELVRNNFTYKGFASLYKFMTKKSNEATANVISEIKHFYINDNNDIIELIESKNPGIFGENPYEYKEENDYITRLKYDAVYVAKEEIDNFIREDLINEFNIDKEYIVISSNYPSYYYTNNLDGFYNALAKAWNEQYGHKIKLNENI